ncbi:MAG TPA: class I SAM-dependent methyltransferase [Pyrinomonadaceae bacterium]|jgi:ubiquinone/menaquinone biosynthesis C-methylase UbiE
MSTVSKQLVDNYAGYYHGESRWRAIGARDKAANIIKLCSGIPHETILDIGAGEGAVLSELRDFGKELHAIELSPSGAEAIQQRNIPGLKSVQVFDGYKIPFPDKSFNLAYLSHVIEHVEHPRALLYEAKRVAEYVFVEVPLEDTLTRRKDYVATSVGHINRYSPNSIRWLLQSCDLRVVKQIVTNPSWGAYKFKTGMKALPRYAMKEGLLRLLPSIATRIWSYHSALLTATR